MDEKNRFAFIILVLVVAITILLLITHKELIAAIMYHDLIDPAGNPVKLQVITPTSDHSIPAETAGPVLSNRQKTVLPVALSGGDRLKEIKANWNQSFLAKETWIHLVYSSSSQVANGVILPNGSPMAQSYISDGWYYLNNEGLVVRDVIVMKDNAGNTLQQTAYNKGVEINFTTKERGEGIPPYTLNLDLGYGQDMLGLEIQGVTIANNEAEYKGKASQRFTATAAFKDKVNLSNSPAPVESITYEISFDAQTNSMNYGKKIWRLNNGENVVFEENEIIQLEKTEPVKEITDILEKVK